MNVVLLQKLCIMIGQIHAVGSSQIGTGETGFQKVFHRPHTIGLQVMLNLLRFLGNVGVDPDTIMIR